MTYIMQEYDDALQYILKNGVRKSNRTGVDTLSIFGMQCRYKINQFFPILTKRKMFYNSIFKELLWIISGSTNVNELEAMGSKIWTAWRDKEFEKKNGYMDGELGPIYGHQLRYYGADYRDDKGFDQLQYVIDELKTNKQSRRILFTYWNPLQVTTEQVRLSPCHHTAMFSIDNENRLSCMLFQRSADWICGVPANVQFYSAMTYMLAQQCNLTPYELIHSTADSHVYLNQISGAEEYLSRQEIASPSLILNKADSMFKYKPESFIVENYNPLEKIFMPVAV